MPENIACSLEQQQQYIIVIRIRMSGRALLQSAMHAYVEALLQPKATHSITNKTRWIITRKYDRYHVPYLT